MVASENTFCPCCGATLASGPPTWLVELFILCPAERRLMKVLARRFPWYVDREILIDALYGDRSDGGPLSANNVLSVHLCQLRRALEPFGWTVSKGTSGRGGCGRHRLEKTGQRP